jgi:hypothetical protein
MFKAIAARHYSYLYEQYIVNTRDRQLFTESLPDLKTNFCITVFVQIKYDLNDTGNFNISCSGDLHDQAKRSPDC